MLDFGRLAEALMDALENTPIHVTVGSIDDIPILTQKTMKGIYFFFDLAKVEMDEAPTKEEAIVLLNKLNDYYQKILDASDAFVQYMSDKEFSAQLGVYVERICFPFCSMTNGEFQWEKQ